jgi:DNA-binding transcriptional LysR family regulator
LSRSHLDLNLLAILEALHAEGSASGAARRLQISQPTLSAALSKLRLYFRDPLFIRTRAGMKPTPFALSLRQPVRQMLGIAANEMRPKGVFSPELTNRTFTLTTSDVGELCFLPLLIAAFERLAPLGSLVCVSLPPEEVQRAIASGDIDVALGYFPDLDAADLERQFLFHHPFVCITRRDHPLLTNPPTLEAFLAASHAVVHQKGRSQELVEKTMRDLGINRRVLLQSPHFMSLPVLIATTDLVSIVPRLVATSFPGAERLQMLPPPLPLPQIPLAQYWSRRAQSDPAVMWLIALITELFLGRDPTMNAAGKPSGPLSGS